MTPVYSIKNQYQGINAHLHSLLQGEGGWGGFHTVHIGDLYKLLNAQLLPMGYIAGIEDSLQIRRVGDSPRQPRADVMVYDTDPVRSAQPSTSTYGPAQTLALPELLDEHELSEKPYRAIIISELQPTAMRPGDPVVWIELLSPTNKGSSEDAELYRAKRAGVMVSGLVFVEIDYLHETPPTFHTIQDYRPSHKQPAHPDAHPYRIIVIDPRPRLEKGQAQIAHFDVDQPFPLVEIPLNAGDVLKFDFGAPYRKTFEEGLYGRRVDYRRFPLNFDRYGEADQARIAARMLAVLNTVQASIDPESNAPLPVENVSFGDALIQLKELGVEAPSG